jgi:Tfp pilus assembly protein PilX
MASKTTSSKNTNKPSKGKKSNMSTATGGQQKNKNTPLETALAAVKTVPVIKQQGQYLSTQDIANRVGRNWQFINRQRHAGVMCDYVAVLQNGTYMYRVSDVRKWAESRGLPFGRN